MNASGNGIRCGSIIINIRHSFSYIYRVYYSYMLWTHVVALSERNLREFPQIPCQAGICTYAYNVGELAIYLSALYLLLLLTEWHGVLMGGYWGTRLTEPKRLFGCRKIIYYLWILRPFCSAIFVYIL